ncbi:MAG: DUF4446 family protein [Tissierella sp.]|uniref:DUF4446 family protein n=1 Tax=Tissierella sp. TaxID=41274 RepID=UPI003F9CD288
MEYLYIIREFVIDYMAEFIIFLYIGFLILLIAFLVSNHKNRKILDRYNSLVRNFDGENLEELIIYLQNYVNDLNGKVNTLKLDLEEIDNQLNFTVQNIGFIRYNAFDGMGNEMSYSIALLDKLKNGFVITNIYGRKNNMNYAKEIKDGIGNRKLSAEEIIAVDRALDSQMENA